MKGIHHLVIVGGGIAGMDLATHLAGRRTTQGILTVTLIDREPAHVWKPMLHTIAAGTRDIYQQQTSYIAQARQYGFVFQIGEVITIDRISKSVHLAPFLDEQEREILGSRKVKYDTLILALGSKANDFSTPGVTKHCFTIDSRSLAIAFNKEVRSHLFQAIDSNKPLKIGIVGGGATGVELAAELVQLAEYAEFYGASGMAELVKVILIESGDRILQAFPERISILAKNRLEELGVTVHTGARVTQVNAKGFQLQETDLVNADIKVWAAGVKAPEVLTNLKDLDITRTGQIIINSKLRTTKDKDIYAVGDCSSLLSAEQEHPLPPTAQVAHQQARYLTTYLPQLISGEDTPNFHFRDAGSLVSLGGYGAFGSLGKFGFFKGGFIRGRIAQFGHVMLYRAHQSRIHGFWRGSLMWLVDLVNNRIRPSIRLD